MTRYRLTLLIASAIVLCGATKAQHPPAEPPKVEAAKPAPYDDKLARLSEILGAVHYLRNLCNDNREPEWRSAMERLLSIETGGEAARRERMTAAFNRGYRSFASIYSSCTASAVAAEENYRNEGATLAGEITARFGN